MIRRSDIRMSDQQLGCCGCVLLMILLVPMIGLVLLLTSLTRGVLTAMGVQ